MIKITELMSCKTCSNIKYLHKWFVCVNVLNYERHRARLCLYWRSGSNRSLRFINL